MIKFDLNLITASATPPSASWWRCYQFQNPTLPCSQVIVFRKLTLTLSSKSLRMKVYVMNPTSPCSSVIEFTNLGAHAILFQSFCCRSAAVLRIIVQLHDPIWAKLLVVVLIFDSRKVTTRCLYPVAAKQAQILTIPPPCLTVYLRLFRWYAVQHFEL